MKKHAIIPVFIPHQGCKNDCVFCNQRIITAKTAPVTPVDVKNIIETYLDTLLERNLDTIEIAFYGGSFTGIPLLQQTAFLEVANYYYEKGLVDNIHLSTRPDYINREILTNLKKYHVGVIELGVQSFDEEVLKKSKRVHSLKDVYDAIDLIKEYGFDFGIQLMIGLPGDSKEKCINSAKQAAKLKPQLSRLYPTVVFPDTELCKMYKRGEYIACTEDEYVDICKEMYKILDEAGITIMRVGLKSTDLVTDQTDLSSNYHPAFRQLVEGAIAKDSLVSQLDKLLEYYVPSININDNMMQKSNSHLKNNYTEKPRVSCYANALSFSNMIGQNKINKNYILDHYNMFNIRFKINDHLKPGVYVVEVE